MKKGEIIVFTGTMIRSKFSMHTTTHIPYDHTNLVLTDKETVLSLNTNRETKATHLSDSDFLRSLVEFFFVNWYKHCKNIGEEVWENNCFGFYYDK